jgi:hypothetical protein
VYKRKGDIPVDSPIPDGISVTVRGDAGVCMWKNVSEVLWQKGDNISFRQAYDGTIVDLHGPYSIEVSKVKKK